jgi:hypothetical protein
LTRRQREARRQRLVIIIVGTFIGLAALALIAGLLYDQVWVPTRPVATVGSETLTRRAYWEERRAQIAQSIVQSLQLERLLGGGPNQQLGGQIAGQINSLNAQVPTIRSAPVDPATVDEWIKRAVIAQGAARMKVSVTEGDVAQRIVNDLGRSFPELKPPVITGTATLTGTAAPTVTAAPTAAPPAATAAISGTTPAATGAAGTPAPTATTGPTATPPPTATPVPTLPPDAALQQVDAVIGRAYDAYTQQLQQIDPSLKINLTLDDFKRGVKAYYRSLAFTDSVEAQLVPEAGFTPSTDPSNISVRHILIKATVPVSATESERQADLAKLRPQADAIVAELKGGADFEKLAKEKSQDGLTRDKGGLLPSFDKSGKTEEGTRIDPAIVQAALALPEKGISAPIATPFGWSIIQVVSKTVPTKEDQLREARSKAFDAWLEKERAAIGVTRYPPETPTPRPLPTATPAPLPTAILGGEPTPTPTPTAAPEGPTLPTPTP